MIIENFEDNVQSLLRNCSFRQGTFLAAGSVLLAGILRNICVLFESQPFMYSLKELNKISKYYRRTVNESNNHRIFRKETFRRFQ